MLIKNGQIFTMEDDVISNGYVLVENSNIVSVGDMQNIPGNYCGDIVDANGGIVLPGFVDAHTHMGLFEDSLGFEGEDGNEDTDPITPHLRVIDAINPMERSFKEALNAGVTSVVVSPGSANPIGGQISAISTYGRRIDDMILKSPVAVKMALGENPKSVYNDKNQTPATRMATTALIRETLLKSQEYMKNKQLAADDEDMDEPDYDIKYESLIPVLKKDIPIHFHAHRADDIFTAIRIAKEFDVDYVIVHGTEAYLVSDLLEDTRVITGPVLTDRSKPELTNLSIKAPVILNQAGVPMSISTDHPETPVKYILDCALKAVKEGMDEMEALKAITIYSAQISGIDHVVGSLKEGKRADIIIYTDNPFDYKSKLKHVIAGGRSVILED